MVEDREVDFPDGRAVAGILKDFGFAHPDATLHPISREDATALIAHLVGYDQAYSSPTGALEIADACGEQFVGLFPPDARFFTNSSDRGDIPSRAWTPLTSATFDSGVLAIAAKRVGIIWFEDED